MAKIEVKLKVIMDIPDEDVNDDDTLDEYFQELCNSVEEEDNVDSVDLTDWDFKDKNRTTH